MSVHVRRFMAAIGLAAFVMFSGLVVSLSNGGPNDPWPSTTTTAHAAGGACGNFLDRPGVVYGPRNYQSITMTVWDSNRGAWDHLNTDLEDFEYTGFDGQCYIGYRGSSWPSENVTGNWGITLRKRSVNPYGGCDYWQPNDNPASQTNNRGIQALSWNWDGITPAVTLNTQYGNMTFFKSSGCGKRADNMWTTVTSFYFSATPASNGPGSNWWLQIAA